MTGAARKPRAPETDHDDEITIERRVRIPSDGAITTRMTKIDERLLAIARGELDPDDPFGGLIPIYENEADGAEEIDADWLVLASEPPPRGEEAERDTLFGDIVPRVRMRMDELLGLPLDGRAALFLSQIDGRRTLEDVIDACGLDELSGLEVIDDLLRHAVIELG